MFYKIIDIKTIEPNGILYALVYFWKNKGQASKSPDLINDFYIAINSTREVFERDLDGNKITIDGKVVSDEVRPDPKDIFKTKVEQVDIPAALEKTIERFIIRAEVKKYKGDLSDKRPKNEADPKNIKNMVVHMKGVEKDVNI